MTKIGHLICLAATLQSATMSFPALGDTVVPQPQYGYTVALPQGWAQIPTDVIDKQIRAINDATGAKMQVKFVDGFQPAGEPWFQYSLYFGAGRKKPVPSPKSNCRGP